VSIRMRIIRSAAAVALLVSAPAEIVFGSAGPAAAQDGPRPSAEYARAFIGNGVVDRRIVISGDSRLFGSNMADVTPTDTASGVLSASLLQQSADTVELTVDNSGADLDTYFTAQITGLGDYTITATPADICTQSDTDLNCTYSTPLSTTSTATSITLTFSGGSGPLDLDASIAGYILDAAGLPIGTGDAAEATLEWIPGLPSSPTSGSSTDSGAPSTGTSAGGGSSAGSAGGSSGGQAGTTTRTNVAPIPVSRTAGAGVGTGGPGVGPGSLLTPQARSAPSTQFGDSPASNPTHLGAAGNAASSSDSGGSDSLLVWGLLALALILFGTGGGWLYVARRRTKAAYAAAASYVPPVFDPESADTDVRQPTFRSRERN
jgi:hypothetical protein